MERALEIGPESAQALFTKGLLLRELVRADEALAASTAPVSSPRRWRGSMPSAARASACSAGWTRSSSCHRPGPGNRS